MNEVQILIVNNDQSELDMLKHGLTDQGFSVHSTTSPHDALQILKQTKIDVALVDLMISQMNGLKFVRMLHNEFPQLISLLTSDYLLSPAQLAKADTGAVGFIPTHCCFQNMADFVREKIASQQAKKESTASPRYPSRNSKLPFDIVSVQCTC